MKTRRSPRNQQRLYRAIGKELSESAIKSRLFMGVYPCGIVYADMAIEEHGDFKRVAFLPYSTLVLDVDAPKSPLMPAVLDDVKRMQALKGTEYRVSECGQTVLLGGKA